MNTTDNPKLFKEGYLDKRERRLFVTRRRNCFCILNSDGFKYVKGDTRKQKQNSKGEVFLPWQSIKDISAVSIKPNVYELAVYMRDNIIFFTATNLEERDDWTNTYAAIKEIRDYNQKPLDPKLRLDEEDIQIGDRVGKGGYATVYRGTWNDRTIAIKMVSKHSMLTTSEEFAKEVNALKALKHPHIVRLYGYYETERDWNMVTEYVAQGALDYILHKSGIELSNIQKMEIAIQISDGMRYLESKSIIHRDLKPANVLLESIDPVCIKLCDFGQLRVQSNTMTMTNAVGTPAYTAPEVVSGKYSGKVDVFSYGLMLWEIIHGEKPWSDTKELYEIYDSIQEGKRPPLAPQTMGSTELTTLIDQSWSQNPDTRPFFCDIYEALLEINKILHAGPTDGSENYKTTRTKMENQVLHPYIKRDLVPWGEIYPILAEVLDACEDSAEILIRVIEVHDDKVAREHLEKFLINFPLEKEPKGSCHHKGNNSGASIRSNSISGSLSTFSASESDGTISYVDRLLETSWFFPFIKDNALDVHLKKDGDFIIRLYQGTGFEVCFKVNKHIKISLITHDKITGEVALRGLRFKDLIELVETHRNDPYGIFE